MKPPLTIEACKQHRDALAAGVSPCLLDHDTVHVLDSLLIAAKRYEWLRENPAFESEAFLDMCDPLMFDDAVDKAMNPLTFEQIIAKHCKASA